MHIFSRLRALGAVAVLAVGCGQSRPSSRPATPQPSVFTSRQLPVHYEETYRNVVVSLESLKGKSGKAEISLLNSSGEEISTISATGSFTSETMVGGRLSGDCDTVVKTAKLLTFNSDVQVSKLELISATFRKEPVTGDDHPNDSVFLELKPAAVDLFAVVADGEEDRYEAFPYHITPNISRTELFFTKITESPRVFLFDNYQITSCGSTLNLYAA
jgi:hypothetical protein